MFGSDRTVPSSGRWWIPVVAVAGGGLVAVFVSGSLNREGVSPVPSLKPDRFPHEGDGDLQRGAAMRTDSQPVPEGESEIPPRPFSAEAEAFLERLATDEESALNGLKDSDDLEELTMLVHHLPAYLERYPLGVRLEKIGAFRENKEWFLSVGDSILQRSSTGSELPNVLAFLGRAENDELVKRSGEAYGGRLFRELSSRLFDRLDSVKDEPLRYRLLSGAIYQLAFESPSEAVERLAEIPDDVNVDHALAVVLASPEFVPLESARILADSIKDPILRDEVHSGLCSGRD